MGNKDTSSLAHTTYECKYHIVFTPKYRRQVIYGKIRADIGKILRQLCEYKGVEIIEAEACKDHIHMLVSILPKYSVSQIMGHLKGKSSIMIDAAFDSCQTIQTVATVINFIFFQPQDLAQRLHHSFFIFHQQYPHRSTSNHIHYIIKD